MIANTTGRFYNTEGSYFLLEALKDETDLMLKTELAYQLSKCSDKAVLNGVLEALKGDEKKVYFVPENVVAFLVIISNGNRTSALENTSIQGLVSRIRKKLEKGK